MSFSFHSRPAPDHWRGLLDIPAADYRRARDEACRVLGPEVEVGADYGAAPFVYVRSGLGSFTGARWADALCAAAAHVYARRCGARS